METIKTAVVVVLLLAVLYGVYVVLNRPDLGSSAETAWDSNLTGPPQVDEGAPIDPNAAFPDTQQGYVAAELPEMPSTSFGQADKGSTYANVTDRRVPTPAGPPPGSNSEAIQAPDLISKATVAPDEVAPDEAAPDEVAPEGANVSVYDSTSLYQSPAEGAAAATFNDRGPEPGISRRLRDETEDVSPELNRVFQNAWNAAVGQLEAEQWEEALLALSLLYNNPNVTGEDRSRLMDLLDPLAGKVIYSNEHTIDPPYQVRPGDTLQSIADRYQVPAALLRNINGVRDPSLLQPGTQLKVLRGPFRAEIDRKRSELVLFLGGYYAGRFAISVGNDPDPKPAEYQVQAKQPGREYYAPDRSRIPAKAPDNPYGDWWIGLSSVGLGSDGLVGDGLVGDVCIHGSPEPPPQLPAGLGCVSLSSADAADVYQILTVGSKVSIR